MINKTARKQLSFDAFCVNEPVKGIETPQKSISAFLDLLGQTVPEGDLYLFGGILRDLALFGSRGFNSDLDIVIDGNWDLIAPRMENLGAIRNKFGGLRFYHETLPIDVWQSRETWAIKEGYVEYKDITSLLKTTVLNWDAILMNWRTKSFFYRSNYFEEINARYIDIVLEQNPNPLGMLIRVLRHILIKDAQEISGKTVEYIRSAVSKYSYDDIKYAEISSYGSTFIRRDVYMEFKNLKLKQGAEKFFLNKSGFAARIKSPTLNLF